MAIRSYLPGSDPGLLAWGNHASSVLGPTGADYGLDAATLTAYNAALAAYAAALAAVQPTVRNKGTVIEKNQKRSLLKQNIRAWVATVNATQTVTDQMRSDLGLTVRKQPSPIGPPTTAPAIETRSAVGRTVTLKLHDAVGGRSKPSGVKAALLYSYAGTTPPEDVNAWNFEGACSRSMVRVVFPNTVANGAQVWFTGCWVNERMQPGPATTPVTCNIPGGSVSTAA